MYFLPSDNVKIIEHILNKQFSSIWKWLIDNKLLVHFEEDKPKPILSSEAIGLKKIIICIYIYIYIHIYTYIKGWEFYEAGQNSRVPGPPP